MNRQVFQMDDAIDRLNALAAEFVKNQVPLRTTEELREFFKNPPQRAYSVLREEAMTSVVKLFEAADDNGRRAITSRLSVSARNGFLGYSVDMAVLAVRNQSAALIEQGLVALVIEGGSQDYRDSIVALAKLHHSAVKLGMDSRKALEKAASLADPGVLKDAMKGFPLRPPEERDLKALYQGEEFTEEGFRYKQALPWPQPTAEETQQRPIETPQQVSARLNSGQQKALIGMAEMLAAMAVRKQSPSLVEQGLQGLALGGGALDSSHSLVALAKLHHSALKLGMNVERAFAEAAQFAPPGDLQTEMTRFPLRDPKDRDLAAFNLQEEITEKGFSYKRIA
jgi:hypothetical protein